MFLNSWLSLGVLSASDLVYYSPLICLSGFSDDAAFFGWLADPTSSRRTPFLFGFIVNAGATALLCFATNIHLLLLSRALQGLSTAIVYTVGFALLADTIGSENLGEWMGYNIMSVNIGITASPAVGGVLYGHAGYYSIFIVIAVLIGLDILLRIVIVEKRTAAEWIEEDIHTGENAPTQYGTFESVSAGPSQQENPSTSPTDSPSSERHERSRLTKFNTSTGVNTPTESRTLESVSAGPSQQKHSFIHFKHRSFSESYKRPSLTKIDTGTDGNTPTQYGTFEPVVAGPSQQKHSFIHFKHGSSSEPPERPSLTKINTDTNEKTPSQYRYFEPVAAGPSQRENPSTDPTDGSFFEPETSSSTKSNASIENRDLRDVSTKRRASYPSLLVLLSSPRILADLYATFVTISLHVSFDSALPIFLERTFGWASTGAGLIFFTITLPILGAPLAGKFTDRYQSHWIPAAGYVIVGVLTALLQLVKHDTAKQVALLAALLTLNGRDSSHVTRTKRY